ELPQNEVQKRVRALVEELGYYETLTVRPAELSVGEQKLIAIARALITDPEIVFMDDPTANLDDDSIEHVYNKITKLRKRGVTLLIATNNEELLYRFADYIGVMKLGKLEIFGCYEDVIENTAVSMKGTLQRLKRRGRRVCEEEIIGDGSEMSNRSDV
ncbi:MAG TPA: ATP-binding cassette domain-containing protein, partial [Spirochaetales bacterium]|nr:ATP-binding cassette domain-containing protein [Spirochaetales bacterium]